MESEKKFICNNLYKYIIDELANCIDNEIFSNVTIEGLGEFYYKKALAQVDGATDELLQNVIRFMDHKETTFGNLTDYYKSLCKVIGIKRLPSKILSEVKEEFDDIFVRKYNLVKQKANNATTRINNKLQKLKADSDSIKNAPPNYSLMRDLSSDELKLYEYGNECNLLRTRKEMIEFVVEYMTSKLMEFCDIHDINSIDIAIKEETLKLSKSDTYEASVSFLSYKSIVEITEDDLDRPYALFFKVKFYTAAEKVRKNLYATQYTLSEEARIEQYETEINNIPKIDDLQHQKENDQGVYLSSLRRFVSEYLILDDLKSMITESICLRDRKDILTKCIELYNAGEFELFGNIAPIQIEGMFADFLRDTTTFRRFTKLEVYDGAVLREKIKYLQDVNSDIYPEAVEYFMFYFNNIIRNKVAHGNYKNIFKDRIQAEIFATEVILDMNMLIYMLSRKSETEKMYRFISGYQKYYTDVIKSEHPCFGALLNDMIGDKIISNYDSIEKYRPIQVAYWLVNPYYEKIYEAVDDKKELLELRNQFLSKEFWLYVLNVLNDIIETGYDYRRINMEFISIVNGLFRCDITDEVKGILGQVNAALHRIKAMDK
ncbi:hypothetical protein [Bacillus pacificus]|uniref:hypothetical protein n=1 Tax=Bacillus pacificus TaxID=2026187 RepID=UPI001D0EFB8C|nr:hypothetical protein [Bacillus pacificus]MCC2348884.1 hypothetical protein [Bacillus pacificus]MCC2464627.1 hypothetical protein [Bacillus pacificus]